MESFPNGWKTLWEKEKLLITSNFSFSHSVFKRLVLQTRKNQGLFGKGLRLREMPGRKLLLLFVWQGSKFYFQVADLLLATCFLLQLILNPGSQTLGLCNKGLKRRLCKTMRKTKKPESITGKSLLLTSICSFSQIFFLPYQKQINSTIWTNSLLSSANKWVYSQDYIPVIIRTVMTAWRHKKRPFVF